MHTTLRTEAGTFKIAILAVVGTVAGSQPGPASL